MNPSISYWTPDLSQVAVDAAEISDEMSEFLQNLNISDLAAHALDQAFSKQIPRGIKWICSPENESAVTFASSIYKRGWPVSTEIRQPEVTYGNVELTDDFTICDREVYRLFPTAFKRIPDVLIQPSESGKSLATVNTILEAFKAHGGKSWQIIGGGIVLDVGLFAADLLSASATLIPTTFLAMVDVAIGGKCGVNYGGKNQLGRFAFSKKICIDEKFLHTLSLSELRMGCAEAIKHGVIENDFALVSALSDACKTGDLAFLITVLPQLIATKQRLVAADPFDRGARQILNFGHTVAHALEAVFQQPKVSHGEAVAIGMVMESFFAYQLKIISASDLKTLDASIRNSSILSALTWQDIRKEKDFILSAMKKDKKNKFKNYIAFSLPYGPGFIFSFSSPVKELTLAEVESFLGAFFAWK